MGSALLQKSIPTAIVVHKTIANQLNQVNLGFADSPPIRYFPSGLTKTTKHKMVIANESQLKPSEKFTKMVVCKAEMLFKNSSGKTILIATTRIKRINGGQKTKGLILNLKKPFLNVIGKNRSDFKKVKTSENKSMQ